MRIRCAIILICGLFLTCNIGGQSPAVAAGSSPKTLTAGLEDLSQQIATRLSQNQKRRIAVLEFVDLRANVTDLGRYCAESLITKLFQSNKFTVVERNLLNKIIAEQKLSLSSIIDPASAQKLGKVLGVDAIAVGSVSDLTKNIELNARLLSSETGEVFSAASVEIIKDDTVRNLMSFGTSNPVSPSNADSNATLPNGAANVNPVATKDLGSLRVKLKSVRQVKLPEGSGIQCLFEFSNLEPEPIGVAMNGAAWSPNPNDSWLRSKLIDSNGGLWRLDSSSVNGVSFVRAQQRITYPRDWYAPTDIATVLSITDAPESNLARNGDYRLFRGSTTELAPGGIQPVTLTFVSNEKQATSPNSVQISAEIVVGVGKTGTKKLYKLYNLVLDQVSVPGGN